jgi:hypothetical protein
VPQVAALPHRLARRHLDLGDVSPADSDRFLACLNQVIHTHLGDAIVALSLSLHRRINYLSYNMSQDVDGIQTDFDDGHCPTWHNQLQGW